MAGCLISLPALAVGSIGVNFQGRDGTTTDNPGTDPLAPSESAGVVPQGNWNNVDDAYAYTPANSGTTPALVDSAGVTTAATLTFNASDSWFNDVNPTNIVTPNARLMNGFIKAGTGTTATFTFNGLPDGQYDAYVYISENGDNALVNVSDAAKLTTFYAIAWHQFNDTNSFVQAINTNPAGPRDLGNYVKFDKLATYGTGSLGFTVTHVSGTDGTGIPAIQLVPAGPDVTNTNEVSITTQPSSRRVVSGSQVTLSVATRGPLATYQWYKNSAVVGGATSATYQTDPVTVTGDTYYVVVNNNVNTVQSSNAVITLGQLVQTAGLAKQEYWAGLLRADVEDPGFSTPPDFTAALPAFETPNNQADNYTERVSALFAPPVTGNYVFFVSSDDDSDLFLSTDATPANKALIAQETAWSGSRNWIGSDGGSIVTQKRSDKWVEDTTADPPQTPPYAAGIHLDSSKLYYVEGVHHEGGGGDDFAATYKLVDAPDPTAGSPSALQGFLLAPYTTTLDGATITVTNPPANTIATQSSTATLSVGAVTGYLGDTSGAGPGIAYQWQSAPAGSSSFTDIPGALGASYITPVLTLADNNRQYRVHLLAGDTNITSTAATLTVNPDTIPPKPTTINSVSATFKVVNLTFNELMDKASAEVGANYVFNPGNVAGASASLDASGKVVTITTGTALTPNTENTLAITGVKDLAGNPTAANTTIKFTFQPVTYEANIEFDGPLGYYRFEETSGAVAKNNGSTGGDGAYYTGDEASPGEGGTPSSAKGDPGPQPPDFAGFDASNRAATFGGDTGQDWVDTKNQFLQNRGAFSLEYWVKPVGRTNQDTPWSPSTRIGIVGQNDAIEYGFIDSNTIQIWTPNGGSLNSPYSFADGAWHHVATIADGTSLKTYYDGVLQASAATTTSNYGSSVYNVHIGGGGVFDVTGNWFTGQIDEVAIFDKAIPADRIAAHYQAGKEGGVLTVSGAVTPGTAAVSVTTAANGDVIITFTGTLLAAPTLNGTFTAVAGAVSPYTVPQASIAAQQYYGAN